MAVLDSRRADADDVRMPRRLLRALTVLLATVPLLLVAAPADATLSMIYRLRWVGTSRQVVAVTNRSWSSSSATFQAFAKGSDGKWRTAFGPWTARIGRNGFGSPKREGDGQSPVGAFPVPSMFGVRSNPGVRYPWLKVDGYDVWVDDPASAYYNKHMRKPANGRWRSAESLYQPAPYAYAAFVGYNLAAKPGAGSAIFFHASTGGYTAGCVSLPPSQVVSVLRWLDPAKSPRFVMGPESAVTWR
jgi:L,D-peptidoglycan transpeptidase YkuD (ErfK/YbiS/YcfS/YnhG family)